MLNDSGAARLFSRLSMMSSLVFRQAWAILWPFLWPIRHLSDYLTWSDNHGLKTGSRLGIVWEKG
jgi:hypothetical protein